MSRSTLPIAFLTALLTPSLLHAAPPAFEDPPYEFKLTVGDQIVRAFEGQPTPIEIDGKARLATVTRSGLRRLSLAGLSFDYPADFGFDFGDEPDYEPRGETWFLTGIHANLWVTRVLTNREKAAEIAVRAEMRDFTNNGIKWSAEKRELMLNNKPYKATVIVAKRSPYDAKPVSKILFDVPQTRCTYVVCLSGEMESPNRYGEAFLRVLKLLGGSLTTMGAK